MFSSKTLRYLKIEDNNLVIEERSKNQRKIKSKTPLERLFQINVEVIKCKLKNFQGSIPSKLNMLFINGDRNPAIPPLIKSYKIDSQDLFIDQLTKALKKINLELKLS